MRRFKLFTMFYLVAAIAFAVIGLQSSFELLYLALVTFIVALCSSFPWWRRTTLALGKGNVIFGWTVITILVGLQVYGLVSGNFGLSPLLISILVLMLIATADTMNVLRGSS